MIRVWLSGCFDGPSLHDGHLKLLAEAAAQGDSLTVALNSDDSPALLAKGKDRPIIGQTERVRRLRLLPYVTAVVLFRDECDLEELLRVARPDVRAIGEDYRGKPITGEQYAGHIHFVERLPGYSTTAILQCGSSGLQRAAGLG